MQQDKRALRILCLFGILPVTWLGLMSAPALSEGLIAVIARFT